MSPPAPTGRRPRRRRRPTLWRGVVLALAAVYFLTPLVASFVFTVDTRDGVSFDAYTGVLGARGFTDSLLLSLSLAVATIALSLALAVPALVAVRLGPGWLRPVVETVCTLPLVVPPIALVVGINTVLRWGPEHLARTPLYQTFLAVQNPTFPVVLVLAYTVTALPFVYRSLDAGLRVLDVRTLVEAARSCGAGRWYALARVIVPNLRSALAGASFLTLALVLGEYTVARLLGYRPFPVWIVEIADSQGRMSVAVSILSLLVTWALLVVLSRAGAGGAASGIAAPAASGRPVRTSRDVRTPR
ncbi:ABC transporter permease subunit [Streptomyces alkaliphilus]|uniref:ABC transporter permease subunit n=1 Tax=Streptomyces alkaliphilus TaxID=1472722 RepID=A0A7W3Y0C8_9ACTN|nr:ABC transporter permease subunit [Streptomyces alkaliphilus]MBB0243268.1 ABC transporter permease subunit [Streptomyces alkaliphilus]